ncbi:MAG: hypothetical protein WCF66_14915, partial [Pseudolabrys sp.]
LSHSAMSALPLTADIDWSLWHVRFVPKADIAMTSNSRAAPPEIFHVPSRIRRVADSANPLGDPLYQKQEPI